MINNFRLLLSFPHCVLKIVQHFISYKIIILFIELETIYIYLQKKEKCTKNDM
jgi:hypothetical protein